jgi:hypothetical protein
VATATEEMKNGAIDDFKGVTDFLSTWNSTYGSLIDTAVSKTSSLSRAVGELSEKLTTAMATYDAYQ